MGNAVTVKLCLINIEGAETYFVNAPITPQVPCQLAFYIPLSKPTIYLTPLV